MATTKIRLLLIYNRYQDQVASYPQLLLRYKSFLSTTTTKRRLLLIYNSY